MRLISLLSSKVELHNASLYQKVVAVKPHLHANVHCVSILQLSCTEGPGVLEPIRTVSGWGRGYAIDKSSGYCSFYRETNNRRPAEMFALLIILIFMSLEGEEKVPRQNQCTTHNALALLAVSCAISRPELLPLLSVKTSSSDINSTSSIKDHMCLREASREQSFL